MPFCHNPRNYISKVVSIRRSIITRKEETCRATSRGKKKRQFDGEVH
jgi:hypothetical protein